MSSDITGVFTVGHDIAYRTRPDSRDWHKATVAAVVNGHLIIKTRDPEGLISVDGRHPDFWNCIGPPF